jgi:hypothetical protein
LGWKMGAEAAGLSITAQEFAFDNMARFIGNKLTELGRPVRRLRFPNKDVPAEMMKFLALDDARREAMDRLIQQASNDADFAKSACDDPNNPEGQMVKALIMDLPEMPKTGVKMEEASGESGVEPSPQSPPATGTDTRKRGPGDRNRRNGAPRGDAP